MNKAVFSLCRFGVGPKIGEYNSITDPLDWALKQLLMEPDTSKFKKLPNTQEMLKLTAQYRSAQKDDKKNNMMMEGSSQAVKKEMQEASRKQFSSHIHQSITTKTPVLEKLALFWGNHFTVSSANNKIRPIVTSYQREVIYPNLSGSFKDLLFAAETHPAMLMYLNNDVSIGENSKFGRRRNRGLNENLAREILELHTLGTSGGYSLEDIKSLAKILTGWTVTRRGSPKKTGKTAFSDLMHEPGKHELLGKIYGRKGGKQLYQALDDIAHHPNTAKFIAGKLATHYISDEPEQKLVDAIAQTFLETNGHLPSIHAKTFELALENPQPFTKARDHYSYVIAVTRAMGYKAKYAKKIHQVLNDMGQIPFNAPGPDGWPDSEENWISPQGLMRRISFAQEVARVQRNKDARSLMDDLFADSLSSMTRQHVRRAESPMQGLVLALASPEFNYV